MKTCTRCKVEKPLDEFYMILSQGKYRNPGAHCKGCNADAAREWRSRPGNAEKHREYSRFYAIKKKYGLEKEQYLEMSKNGCAVCGSFDRLAVDHDHGCCEGTVTCGKCIRGMLCKRHNWAAGNLNDSPEEARKLADYLESTR